MGGMSQNTLPDYHFLFIARELGPEWLFDAARQYWARFRPTIISDFELLKLIPEDYSISVTMIARRDRAAQLGVELAQIASRAFFDPVVYDEIFEAKAELNRRAQSNQPFGVPLIPTATPTPGPTSLPIKPTIGPVLGPGFITQTPTPELSPTPELPTASPTAIPVDPNVTPQQPLSPTPGSVTG
jgi:hypothetical protein